MFTHQTIEGNLQTALNQPNAIVLTENAAHKYFGNQKQITGKVLNVSGSWWTNGDYIVTAVIKNVPSASHFTFDFLIPTHALLQSEFYRSGSGTSMEGNFVTYLQLSEKADLKTLQDKLPSFIEQYQGEELKRIEGKASMFLQPLIDIHLTPGYNLEMSPTIGMDTLYFFMAVSMLVILLAWINYINLFCNLQRLKS
jgi:putative ABC transport system permease protein